MSYYGNGGPSQDGGFLSGINRGSQRLHAARSNRLRHANMNGFGEVEVAKQRYPYTDRIVDYVEQDMKDPADLAKASAAYNTARGDYLREKALLTNMPAGATEVDITNQKNAVQFLQQEMEKARLVLDKEISSGPYVREYKAWSVGSTAVIALGALGVYIVFKNRGSTRRTPGDKPSMYAVFG